MEAFSRLRLRDMEQVEEEELALLAEMVQRQMEGMVELAFSPA
jgi:hypothetical protein